jgi:preprotein translocase subunit SecA
MITARAPKQLGSANDRGIRSHDPRVAELNALENKLEALSDDQLRARSEQFKKALRP